MCIAAFRLTVINVRQDCDDAKWLILASITRDFFRCELIEFRCWKVHDVFITSPCDNIRSSSSSVVICGITWSFLATREEFDCGVALDFVASSDGCVYGGVNSSKLDLSFELLGSLGPFRCEVFTMS